MQSKLSSPLAESFLKAINDIGEIMIYLDNSATTCQYEEVTELIYKLSKEAFGNPSSLHMLGFRSAELIFAKQEDRFPKPSQQMGKSYSILAVQKVIIPPY